MIAALAAALLLAAAPEAGPGPRREAAARGDPGATEERETAPGERPRPVEAKRRPRPRAERPDAGEEHAKEDEAMLEDLELLDQLELLENLELFDPAGE